MQMARIDYAPSSPNWVNGAKTLGDLIAPDLDRHFAAWNLDPYFALLGISVATTVTEVQIGTF